MQQQQELLLNQLALACGSGERVCTYLTGHHMVQHSLHSLAVRQGALPRLAVGLLLAALALVRVQQQHELLLDQLALLRVCDGARARLLRRTARRALRRRLRLRLRQQDTFMCNELLTPTVTVLLILQLYLLLKE